jgi:hypothetical protein
VAFQRNLGLAVDEDVKMTQNQRKTQPAVGTPPAEGNPSHAPMDQLHIMQYLMEIQKELSSVSTKTDRLTADVAEIDNHVGDLKDKVSRADAVVKTAAALITIFGFVLWWFVGGQLTQLKDDLLKYSQSVQQVVPAPPPDKLP